MARPVVAITADITHRHSSGCCSRVLPTRASESGSLDSRLYGLPKEKASERFPRGNAGRLPPTRSASWYLAVGSVDVAVSYCPGPCTCRCRRQVRRQRQGDSGGHNMMTGCVSFPSSRTRQCPGHGVHVCLTTTLCLAHAHRSGVHTAEVGCRVLAMSMASTTHRLDLVQEVRLALPVRNARVRGQEGHHDSAGAVGAKPRETDTARNAGRKRDESQVLGHSRGVSRRRLARQCPPPRNTVGGCADRSPQLAAASMIHTAAARCALSRRAAPGTRALPRVAEVVQQARFVRTPWRRTTVITIR